MRRAFSGVRQRLFDVQHLAVNAEANLVADDLRGARDHAVKQLDGSGHDHVRERFLFERDDNGRTFSDIGAPIGGGDRGRAHDLF